MEFYLKQGTTPKFSNIEQVIQILSNFSMSLIKLRETIFSTGPSKIDD